MYKNIKKIISYSLISSSLFSSLAQADLYYSEKIAGPIVNVFSVNKEGVINKITDNEMVRDLEHNVSINGLVSFSSNRKTEHKKTDEVARSGQAGDYNIYIVDPATKQLTQITNELTQEQQPKFSPSGNELAFLRSSKEQQSLVIYNLETKKERIVATAESIYDYSWSPESSKIAFTNNTKSSANLVAINVKTLASEILVSTSINKKDEKLKKLFVAASWSPNGEYVAYIVHPLESKKIRTLNIHNLSSHKNQLISVEDVQVQAPITWSKNSKALLYSGLVDYQQYYDETIHKKVYLGGMHIFSSDLFGNSKQITKGDHLFKQPIYSPDESSIAYLYADKLNARTLQLKTLKLDGSSPKTLSKSVFKSGTIQWQ